MAPPTFHVFEPVFSQGHSYTWQMMKAKASGLMSTLSIGKIYILYFNYFLKILFIYFQRGEWRERQGNIDVQEIYRPVASRTPPTGVLAHNPGTCPDWKLNQQPFDSQVGTQSTEPHQPGLKSDSFSIPQLQVPHRLLTKSSHQPWSFHGERSRQFSLWLVGGFNYGHFSGLAARVQ